MPPEPVRGASCRAVWSMGDGFRSGIDAAEALRREVRDAA